MQGLQLRWKIKFLDVMSGKEAHTSFNFNREKSPTIKIFSFIFNPFQFLRFYDPLRYVNLSFVIDLSFSSVTTKIAIISLVKWLMRSLN